MIRAAFLGLSLVALVGCGVGTPTPKVDPTPKIDPKPEPEVYDKVAPMPREAKPK